MKLGLPRGLRDLEPQDFEKIRYVYEKFERVAERYCFSLMEPSTIEFLDTLALKSGPEIEEEIYAFRDKAGRDIALRFDLTVGMARYVVSNPQLAKPVKLASYSMMWRYDEPQFARYRGFYQWDVEIFGAEMVRAGGETICFSEDLVRELGLSKVETRVSSRRVIDKILKKYLEGIDPLEAMRIIDKKERQGIDAVETMLAEKGVSHEDVEETIKVMVISDSPEKALERLRDVDAELVEDKDFQELMETIDYARRLGAKNLILDLSVVRGIDYYDGVVFEVRSLKAPQVGSLVGGFNSLMEAFGSDITAFGAAGGIERTVMALEKSGIFQGGEQRGGVYVAITSDEMRDAALGVVERVRGAGIPVEYDLAGRRLGGQLSYAEKRGFRFVVIVGREEWGYGKVALKDFETGEQDRMSIDELLTIFDASRSAKL
jgi:histidyl-tRNA synthetase